MSDWFDSQKSHQATSISCCKSELKKASPRRNLTTEEYKHLAKLETITDKLRRGKNVQLSSVPLHLIVHCNVSLCCLNARMSNHIT